MYAVHLACSIAFGYTALSLLEYAGHRWLLHKMRIADGCPNAWLNRWLRQLCRNHMALHHGKEYRHKQHKTDDRPLQLALTAFLPGLLIAAVIYQFDSLTVKVLLVMGVSYAVVAWLVHLEMHLSQGRLYSRTALFRYLDYRHRMHHRCSGTNFNVLLPCWDWVFGTTTSQYMRRKQGLGLAAH